MMADKYTVRLLSAGAAVAAGLSLALAGTAAAEPLDYGSLPVDPNIVTDSTAYIADVPVLNPQGQTGVSTIFRHRDGSRTITDTIVDYADPQAATDALAEDRTKVANDIPGAVSQPSSVGSGGTILTGESADHTKSVAVLMFTQGNTLTSIEFSGAAGDPAPIDLVNDYGKMQADAISTAQNA